MKSRWLIIFLTLGSLFGGFSIYAEDPPEQADDEKKVYRKFHPDGVVEFSDKPLKGAEELKMEELPTYKFDTGTSAPQAKTQPVTKQKAIPTSSPRLRTEKIKPSGYTYNSLSIISPARNETIRANDGNINVNFTLSPELQHFRGHQIEYLLDGKSILKTTTPQGLKNVDRGTHSLVIQVVDKNNKVLINSDSVTFHVLRFFKPRSKATPPLPKKESDFDTEYET